MTETQTPNQWWSAFPAPRAKCPEVSADEVMKMFDDMDIKPGATEFLLVDVRRTDWEVQYPLTYSPTKIHKIQSTSTDFSKGGTIKTSLNLPAQSFYQTRSSNGRGPRCANWMQDYIDDISKFGRKTPLKVLVLKGGIKGWVKEFEGSLMDGYEEKYWEQFK
ncbi:hypothetical protein LCER1_G005965 [Lachnellula cervina]|uniref:Rhodanese domain-containing protein n=1 Tax=Lachnellula cervina TaxID=1316786 RepID=A0A7D8UKD1_9HELO|nr:hypothetical protein LCER1_G005965 [Lachnellula cervina]